MEVEILTPEQYGEMEEFVSRHPQGGFTQSVNWQKVKNNWGFEAVVSRGGAGEIVGAMSVLIQKIPLIGTSFLYAPRGPVCDLHDQAVLAAAMDQEAASAAATNAANTTGNTTATVSGSNACKKVREAMPECNGAVFEMLLEMFATYLEHPGNGLDAHGFAVCIAPSLLRW